MKEVRLALIYYAIAKKFVHKFVKNDKKRITVEWLKKQKTSCTWRLHASPVTHITSFAIKIFNLVHTWGGDIGADGHQKVSRKFIASIQQNILKHRPIYRVCDTTNDFKAQFGVSQVSQGLVGKRVGEERA